MSKKYDAIVFIGRFQPVHNAHVEIIRRAVTLAHKVIIVIGSANQPRTFKNPFTSKERTVMLKHVVDRIPRIDCDVVIHDNYDTIYNDQAWASRVQQIVSASTNEGDSIAIIGHEKDESSFYLRMFPQWARVDVEQIEPLNATHIRDIYFDPSTSLNMLKSVVQQPVFDLLEKFRDTEDYISIVKEKNFIEDYKRQYASLPYPPIFVTTDAVVVQSGHVLMIKRKAEPGRGLWALPGGFMNAQSDKSIVDCAIRELKEETGIKVPAPVLIGSIKNNHVFDAINRSTRGRTITHAFHIVLPDGDLPKVKGADDAEKAKWIPLGELDSSQCYEDHSEIINYFVGA